MPGEVITEFPFDDKRGRSVERWIDAFLLQEPAPTHLVAIERPGPSHTAESIAAQAGVTSETVERFLAVVPPADRDVCHSMRGEPIDRFTAPTHRVFDAIAARQLPITTIGIGDGGNEIGMGALAWNDLVAAIASGPAERIVCRVPTDFALVAGTSNWGAYALALAVSFLRGHVPGSRWLSTAGQQELISQLVHQAGALDGRTLAAEATVDGLAMDVYLAPLAEMQAAVDACRGRP